MAMTDTIDAPVADAPKAGGPAADGPNFSGKRQWGVALRALGKLLSDKEDTSQVFEIMRALNGDSTARNYKRLVESPGGGRLAYEHVELHGRLMDDAWLDSFAP